MATPSLIKTDFDPASIGAVPTGGSSQPSATFDPASVGAVPADSGTTPATTGQSFSGKLLNFASNTANNIERPFVDVAATPMQLGIGLINKITGKNLPDPYAVGVPGVYGTGNNAIPVASASTLGGASQKAADVANIALMAATPEAGGIRSLGAIGAGSGLAQGLGEGDTNTPDLVKDTIAGGLFGAATGAGSRFLRWMGGVEQGKTGVVGQVVNELKNADPKMVGSYIDNTLAHANDVRVPTPDAMAEDAMVKRAEILVNKMIPEAGKAVGDAHAAVPNLPLSFTPEGSQAPIVGAEAVHNITDEINTSIQNMTGHQFSSYENGGDASLHISGYPEGADTSGLNASDQAVEKLPNRPGIADLTSLEHKQLSSLSNALDTLRQKPTVQTASDILKGINADIDRWSVPQFGENSGNSPVQGVLKHAYGVINNAIRGSAPALAEANDRFSALKGLQRDIGVVGGKTLRSASLLMRRVLSGDKSSEVIPVLDQLSKITQPYMGSDKSNLVQHAIIADWAKRTLGDVSTSGLLQQSVNRGVNDASSIFGYPRQFVHNMIQKAVGGLSPDPAEYALSVASGKPYSMNPVIRGLDELAAHANTVPILGHFTKQLQAMGVTAHNVEPAAKALFKTWLLQSLTHPVNLSPTGGGVSSLTPVDTPQRSFGATLPVKPSRSLIGS